MLRLDPAANLQEIQKKGWEWGGRLKRKRVDYMIGTAETSTTL